MTMKLNAYMCFYKRKHLTLDADSQYAAQRAAAAKFGAKRSYEVKVMLLGTSDRPYAHSTASL